MINKFKKKWDEVEKPETFPRRYSGKTITMDFEELKSKVIAQENKFVDSIVNSFYAGDAYIFKKSYPKEFLIRLREQIHEYGKKSSSTYHKMLENSPDYHRIIDQEVSKLYPYDVIKHSYFFYDWNNDPFQLFPAIYPKWRIFKFLSGFKMNEYENNTPRDGVIDRIQIVNYPAGGGMLELHSDPYKFQKLAFGCMMTKKGVDYHDGGFYVLDENDNKFDIEEDLDIGDYAVIFCTVVHGVDPVDPNISLDWNSIKGRWFLSTFSNESNYTSDDKRHTAYAVKIN